MDAQERPCQGRRMPESSRRAANGADGRVPQSVSGRPAGAGRATAATGREALRETCARGTERPTGAGHAEIRTAQWLQATPAGHRSVEHTSELQSLMRISHAVFCLNKQNFFRMFTFDSVPA